MEEIFIDANENVKLCLRIYDAFNPKGVVQVVHGMCEHQGRYEYLASKLVAHGFCVVTSDLRGHGKSVTNVSELGYFGKNGAENLVEDQVLINDYIRNRYPNLPIYMFAHSMGTLIARNFLKENDEKISKLIMTGAPYYTQFSVLGKFLVNTVSFLSNEKSRSKFLKNVLMSMVPKSQRVDNSWISYDLENIQNYNNDNLCGFMFTNAGYKALAELDYNLHKYKSYKTKNKDLPIMFMSGDSDIVVGNAKQLADSVQTLIRVGYNNVKSKIYNDMKHEIINENNKDIVIADILNTFGFK